VAPEEASSRLALGQSSAIEVGVRDHRCEERYSPQGCHVVDVIYRVMRSNPSLARGELLKGMDRAEEIGELVADPRPNNPGRPLGSYVGAP